MSASLVAQRRSYSLLSRRGWPCHADVRATTHRHPHTPPERVVAPALVRSLPGGGGNPPPKPPRRRTRSPLGGPPQAPPARPFPPSYNPLSPGAHARGKTRQAPPVRNS